MKRRLTEELEELPPPPQPSKFEHWNFLPNEIKAMVIERMDKRTRAMFRNCGKNELELILYYFKKQQQQSVNISVKHAGYGKFIILIDDAELEKTQVKWSIHDQPFTSNVKVIQSGAIRRTVILKNTTAVDTVSWFLQHLLMEPLFTVDTLKFQLIGLEELIDLGSVRADVDCLILNRCRNTFRSDPMFENYRLNVNTTIGVTKFDRFYLMSYGYKINHPYEFIEFNIKPRLHPTTISL